MKNWITTPGCCVTTLPLCPNFHSKDNNQYEKKILSQFRKPILSSRNNMDSYLCLTCSNISYKNLHKNCITPLATCLAILTWTGCFCHKSGLLILFANVHYLPYHLIPTEYPIQSLRLLHFPKLVGYFTSLLAHKINNFLSPPFIYKGLKSNRQCSFWDKHFLVYYYTDKLRYKLG